MAQNTDLKRQIDQLIASLDSAGVNTDNFKRKLREAGQEEQKLVALMDSLVSRLDDADNSASSLYQTMQSIADELKNSNSALNQTKSLYGKLTDDARKLRDDEQGISDLNKQQLKAIQKRYNTNSKQLKEQLKGLESEQAALQAKIQSGKTLSTTEQKRLAQYSAAIDMARDEGKFVAELNDTLKKRDELEKNISKNMGVTGALVQGTGALMERLGMRSGIFHDAMEEATEEMRHQSKLLGKEGTLLERMAISAKGFAIVAKGFGAALFDPAVLIGKIVDGFLNVNKAATELTRLTGQNATAIAGMNSRLATSVDFLETAAEVTRQIGMNATGVFSPDDLGAMAEAKNLLGLTAEQAGNLGIRSKVAGTNIDEYKEGIVAATNEYNAANGAVISHGVVMEDVLNTADSIALSLGANPKALASAAAAARALGMDLAKVDQIAGGLMDFESSIGYELEAQLLTGKNINLSKARELALNNDLEGVSKELAKNGASAAEFSSMNRIQQEALAKALGMSRDDLGKMAQQQLLAAGASIEAQAAARGVSVAQMEQMNIQERIQKSLDKLAQAFAPILDALVPIVETFVSILQPIAQVIAAIAGPLGTALKFITTPIQWIANMFKAIANTDFGKVVIGITLVGIAINRLTGGLQGIGAALRGGGKGIIKYGKSLISAFTNPGESLKKLKDGIMSMKDQFKGGLAGKVQSKAGDWYDKDSSQGKMIRTKGGTVPLDSKDKVKKLGGDKKAEVSDTMKKTPETSEGAGKVKEGTGAKIKEFFTGLAAGLKEMKSKDVLKGALNALLSAPALIALGIASPGLYIMSKIKGKGIEDFFTGLGNGLAAIGKRFGEVVKGSLALGIAGVIIGGSFALALKMVEGVDPAQMLAFSASIAMFGITLALIGKSSSSVIKGALAMGILGVALIPAAFAFKLLEGVNPGQMFAFAGAVTLLGLAAAGLGLLIGPIAMGSAALALLGLALIPMTYGLSLLEGVDIGTIFSFAAGIGILGTTAALLGTAAPLIIAGSAALAVLGLALTPIAHGLSLIGDVGVETIIGFASGIAILGTTAALLGTAAPLIIAGSIAIAALGLALMPVTHAFSLLGDTPIETIVDKLQGLATMAPQLLLVGVALMSIAAGLGMIAMTGIAAIPALMALSTFAIVVTPLASIVGDLFGGEGGGGEDNSMAEISAKLDTLISVVSKGGDVFLDGNKVGDALVLGSYKSS